MFHGSMVALVTPMTAEGEISFDQLKALIEWHIAEGTHAIVIVGTTGESATLTAQEHQQVIRFTEQQVAERVPVIAGTSAQSTQQAIEKTKMAMHEGVDACLIMTPAYIKPTQEGLYAHFKAIADAVAIPQILYNVPSRTAVDLLPSTVARLAEVPNIIGIKEATGDLARVTEIHQVCGDSLDIYSGDDSTGLALMLLGGKGIISVCANVAPALTCQLCEAALKGDLTTARELNARLLPLMQKLGVEVNPIPSKWALAKLGKIDNHIRLPFTQLSTVREAEVLQAMQIAGLID